MSHEPSEGSSGSWRSPFYPRPESSIARPSRLPHIRTSRDGYDLRSPAQGLTQQEAVIDLTEEPETPPHRASQPGSGSRSSTAGRPPRFGRDILEDIVDLEDEEEDISNDAAEGSPSSPDVQFIGSTSRRLPHPLASRGLDTRSALRPSQNSPRRRIGTSGRFPFLSSVTSLLGANARSQTAFDVDTFFLGPDGGFPGPFAELANLDYAMPSFSMASSSSSAQPAASNRQDEYKAPSPAPEGFSRTLGEDDVAVCPNCYWELGTGEGKKQEIWVAKPCGHVCWPSHLQNVISLTPIYRSIVANALKTDHYQRLKKHKVTQRQNHSQSAKSSIAVKLLVHRLQ